MTGKTQVSEGDGDVQTSAPAPTPEEEVATVMEEEEATACAPAPEPEPVVAAPTPAPATAAETIAVATTGNHVVVSPHEVVSTTTTGGKKRKELEQQTEQEKMAQREGEEHDANKKPHVEVFVPCQDARLLWWDADESVESKLRRIKQCMQLQYGERMKTFRQCMEVNALWIANAMEKTAVDQSGDTYRMLEELQAQPSQDDDTHAHTWPAEGGNNRDETRAQMKCHLRASQYLMRQSALTNEAIHTCSSHAGERRSSKGREEIQMEREESDQTMAS
jgi:hypothetical protein